MAIVFLKLVLYTSAFLFSVCAALRVLSYLLSVVLDGKAKDTLGFVTCDQVHFSIEPGVLGRQSIHRIQTHL